MYKIIIGLKTLVVSQLMFLKSLKRIKVVSLLVTLLNSVKWCKLRAKSTIFVVSKLKFNSNLTRITGTLCEDVFAFMTVSCRIIYKM